MTPKLRKSMDRYNLLERDRLWGYSIASRCDWFHWRLSEAVAWATGRISIEAIDEEFGEEGYLVTEQYRAYLEGGNFAWGQMLKALAMRHCHSRTRPAPRRSFSPWEFINGEEEENE